MQLCVQRYAAQGGIHFPSKSNPNGKGYKAYAFRPAPELPMCTCMPFLRGRKKAAEAEGVPALEQAFTCGHLKEVFADTCDWHQTDESEYQIDGVCPKCGGPLVDDESGETPSFTDEEAVADLLAILRGTGADTALELDPEPVPAGPVSDLAADLIKAAKGG